MMPRVLLILCLLLAAVASLHAADPSEQFLSAYESFQQAEKSEQDGNTSEAINKYRFAESLLVAITQSDPSWNKPVIEYRLKKVREGLDRLQGNQSNGTTTTETPDASNNQTSPGATENPTPSPTPAAGDSGSGNGSPSIVIVPPSGMKNSTQDSSNPTHNQENSTAQTRRLQKIIEDLREQLQEATEAKSDQDQRTKDLESADWVQKRSELTRQLDEANRKISDLEHDLHARDSWGDELKDLQKKLDDSVADKEAEEEQFQDSYKKVTDQNALLVKQLQEAKNKVTATADSNQKIEALNEEVAQGKEAVQQLQAKLDQSQQLSKDSLAKNDELQQKLSKTSDQLAVVQKQVEQAAPLRDKIKELQSRADEGDAAIQRNNSLQADLAALQEERDHLAQKVSQLGEAAKDASKVKGLTAEAEDLKKTVSDLQGKLAADQKEMEKAHAEEEASIIAETKTEQLQSKNLADTEADREVLEEERQRLAAKLTQASLWLASLQKQGESIAPLKNELGQLKDQLAQNSQTLDQTSAKLADAEKANAAMQSTAEQKVQLSHHMTDLLTQQNKDLQDQLKTALGKIASDVDHTPESAALQDQVKKLQDQLDQNAKNFTESQRQLTDLEKSQPDQQKALLEKEKALADAKDQSTKLQTKLDQAAQQIETLKKQGDQGDARLKELQDELADRDAKIARLKKKKGNAEAEQMSEENTLLRGIVLREIKEEAKRAQAHRLMEDELKRLNIQSGTLHDQMTQLAASAVELTAQERALFKDADLVVSDGGGENLAASISAPLPSAVNTNTASTSTSTSPSTPAPGEDAATAAGTLPPDDQEPVQAQGGTNATGAALPWQGKFKQLLQQAKDEFDRQDYLEAESTFQESLKLAPNNYFVLSNLGVVEFQLGKMKEAEDSLEKASQQSTNNSFALTTLGIVHYRQTRLADAEKVLRKSIDVNDKDFTAHNYLGIVLAASGKGKEGESELMKAIEINPNYADAHFNLAVIYATGKPPAKMMARKHYDKALELGSPPDPSLEHILQ